MWRRIVIAVQPLFLCAPLALEERKAIVLLRYLAERRDIAVHRDELLRAVWGYLDTDVITRTVDFAIARLRRKIEVDHHHPAFILTAHGDGYCLSGVSNEA